MNCEEALKRLYEVIDKEASGINTKAVRKHLENCRHCMARYEFEAAFKAFVIEKATDEPKTDHLRTRILARIEDTEKSSSRFRINPFRFGTVLLSGAVALVICVLAAKMTIGFYNHKTYIYPFECCHTAYNDSNQIGIGSLDRWIQIKQFIKSDMHLAFDDNTNGYALINSEFKKILGQEFAHIRYLKDNIHISLFIGRHNGVKLPDFGRAVCSGIEYCRFVCPSCQTIYWKEGEALAVAVSEDKTIQLTSFIPSLNTI